ncbi:transglycosylase SLT domain-containing protein [Streptomyces exfoliatus]|uniref:transglycosylase SLT domain-containing protein n=1 Tax=Streptomyces TaxID=1883 RepID=UPI0004C9488C|nr:transglycosylase SLT domain-containing protein [Streptomyces exfoliatus]
MLKRTPTSTRTPRQRIVTQALVTTLLASSVALVPLVAQNAPAEAADATSSTLFPAAEKALGAGYETSGDLMVSGTGDSDGFHIMTASERDGFTFREVASLRRKDMDAGPWTGYVCTTGSGRYAAAVYMPTMWVNKPGAAYRSAFAAVVRLSDGKVTEVAQGVQLAYFSPGCGEDDRVLFSSSTATDTDAGHTTVFEADAATGRIVSDRKAAGRLTHLLPTSRGDYGVLGNDLVRLTGNGKTLKTQKQTKLPGPVFALTASADGALDLGLVNERKSVISRWHGGKLTTLGSGELGKLKLFPRKGGSLAVGDVDGVDASGAPGLKTQPFKGQPMGVSREGHLVTTSVVSDELKGVTVPEGSKPGAASADGKAAGLVRIQATAVRTGTKATVAFDTDVERVRPAKAGGSPAMDPAAFVANTGPRDDIDPRNCGEGLTESQCLSGSGVQVFPDVLAHQIPCLVKRNNPKRQALQPSANMVEWAVNQAVHGNLTLQRPANWHDTGLPAYSPQGLFPKPNLTGGGDIPAQIVLGILAQESNFKQASWHSMNGAAGNVLQADWFGNEASIHYYPNRSKSDCGYGIAQVTSGMREYDVPKFDTTRAGAIATDYATNIAAGMQILAEKWNQLKALGMNVNNGDPQYLENWYMALWGYNSGVYTDPNAPRGLGYFNNPANPNYPPDRTPFLRMTYDDASHPGDWPYQEKVLGWAETPHKTWNWEESYETPDWPGVLDLHKLNLPPDPYRFCSPSVNNCTPNTADPCPAFNDTCRWFGSVSWISDQSPDNSSREDLTYAPGSAEPALIAKYPSGPCMTKPNGNTSAIIVDDLNEREDVYDCGDFEGAADGKFTLQLGDNINYLRPDGSFRATPSIAQIDLHQLGAGYNGHVFFTHSYPESDFFHKVTGRWALNPKSLPAANDIGKRYNVWIHLPNHGAEAIVRYTVIPGPNAEGLKPDTCRVNQGTRSAGKDTWFKLGTMRFWKGGRVEADNLHDAGTGDANVAFDAVAFVPTTIPDAGNCAFGH